MQTEWNYVKILKNVNTVNYNFIAFPASSYTLEYIVVVEINVSEVILIQQLQAIGLGSIVQLDNTTKISTVNVTTGKFRIHYFLKTLHTTN